jgi:hypothetical protein
MITFTKRDDCAEIDQDDQAEHRRDCYQHYDDRHQHLLQVARFGGLLLMYAHYHKLSVYWVESSSYLQ